MSETVSVAALFIDGSTHRTRLVSLWEQNYCSVAHTSAGP